MPRVSLPRKAKVEPRFPQPVVIGEISPRVKRLAKKPMLSNGPNDGNDPRPVHFPENDPQDLDFAPTTRETGKEGCVSLQKTLLIVLFSQRYCLQLQKARSLGNSEPTSSWSFRCGVGSISARYHS
jgi:hypothetical protein